MENKPSGGRFVTALLFFVTTAAIAILLLLTALVIWLSAVTGSFIASALIVGGFFAVLAIVIYLSAIRDAVEQIRRQAENGLRGGTCSANRLRMGRRKGFSLSKAPRGVTEKMKNADARKCTGIFQAFREGLCRHLRTGLRRTGLSEMLRTAFPISAVRVSA